MIKVLQNKILAEEVKVSDVSTIELPDSLKQRKYKVISVGSTRTTLELPVEIVSGNIIQTIPNSGYPVKVEGKEYKVFTTDDVLVVE